MTALMLAYAFAVPAASGGTPAEVSAMVSRASNFAVVPPPLAALAFLGIAGLGLLLLAASAYSALRSQPLRARRLFAGALGLGVTYGLALVGVAFAGGEVTLPTGGEKYFCEIDCHLAYSVESIERVEEAGGEATEALWTVTLRTRFDESTIASFRSREAPLWPNPRRAWVEDEGGERYERSRVAEQALPETAETYSEWDQPLRPGESYRTRLAFTLPAGRRPQRLLLVDPEWVSRLLLGSETSPWHAQVWLRLPG